MHPSHGLVSIPEETRALDFSASLPIRNVYERHAPIQFRIRESPYTEISLRTRSNDRHSRIRIRDRDNRS